MSTNLSTLPSTPLPQEKPKENMFVLYYRQGQNPHPMTKYFYQPIKVDEKTKQPIMQPVVERAKRHCEVLGYRFIRVLPFLSNLDSDERLHSMDYS